MNAYRVPTDETACTVSVRVGAYRVRACVRACVPSLLTVPVSVCLPVFP